MDWWSIFADYHHQAHQNAKSNKPLKLFCRLAFHHFHQGYLIVMLALYLRLVPATYHRSLQSVRHQHLVTHCQNFPRQVDEIGGTALFVGAHSETSHQCTIVLEYRHAKDCVQSLHELPLLCLLDAKKTKYLQHFYRLYCHDRTP